MAEKIFTINRNMATSNLNNLRNINVAIKNELQAGRPVYATIPEGRFRGSIARLKLGNRSISDVGTLFTEGESNWGIKIAKTQHWDLELDGSNRKFAIHWHRLMDRDYRSRQSVDIILGRVDGTVTKKADKTEQGTLVDFLGNEVHDGDYVLMYSSPWELKETGSPFRMLRYTGKRSNKQAQFTYVKMGKNESKAPDGGENVRVGLNSKATEAVSNVLYGVRIDVDESLAIAMQMCDHDMSNFPIKFHVGLADHNSTP